MDQDECVRGGRRGFPRNQRPRRANSPCGPRTRSRWRGRKPRIDEAGSVLTPYKLFISLRGSRSTLAPPSASGRPSSEITYSEKSHPALTPEVGRKNFPEAATPRRPARSRPKIIDMEN
ncbi:hypothetical protein EVAR_12837_1 [Eumeta japonica]|uniref:Uncharacterized protein n=1 Tax=Eumeta variegata TaxID=151549 RepID=A0A4C1UC97_EUMVA|nr:hypothetical protein EVAR_12837_1 [Eumeta japonica]